MMKQNINSPFRLYIGNIPKHCSHSMLQNYFKGFLTKFHIRKSKNKGVKSTPHAVLSLTSLADQNTIQEASHYLEGSTLIVNKFLTKEERLSDREQKYRRSLSIRNIECLGLSKDDVLATASYLDLASIEDISIKSSSARKQ